jgi:hypothetical protein
MLCVLLLTKKTTETCLVVSNAADLLTNLGADSTTIWKYLYSLEKLANYNPFTEYWLPFAFQDPAVLHCFIGCADIYIDYFRQSQNPERGLWHLYEATSIVNKRLLQENCNITAGTLVIVVGMALIEVNKSWGSQRLLVVVVFCSCKDKVLMLFVCIIQRGTDCYDNYRVHMQGLKNLVDMGGGLESFSSQLMIMHKIYR